MIVNDQGEQIDQITYTDITEALHHAKIIGTVLRNAVIKIEKDGTKTPMGFQGPGGWNPSTKQKDQLV